jgi:SagB-type dehydrogenase family enzyme
MWQGAFLSMPKLIGVLLPLLPLLGALLWRSLRGRMPARRQLNAWSSLLLLAYLLATAGLGLFWVARQQLPVFDWHYLFGYVTLALLALHLSLNLGSAWRALRPRAPAPAQDVFAGRRWLLGTGLAGAGLLALGAAFSLGLRLGRNERQVLAAAGGGGPSTLPAPSPAQAWSVVERFHGHSAQSRHGGAAGLPPVSWGDAPPVFKRYPAAARVALPPAAAVVPARADAVAALGAVLWHAAGVTARRTGLVLRASPSSGALFSTELYVAAWAVPGLPPGVWHYEADSHALERLRGGASDAAALGLAGAALPPGALALVAATAVFRRTGRKYRDRAYRYVLADLGHALENLRVAAGALGLKAVLMPAFDEARLAATLGVDEEEEGVLALAALYPAEAAADVVAATADARSAFTAAPLPHALPALGVTGVVHRATSLRLAAAPGTGPAGDAGPLPAHPAPGRDRSAVALPTPRPARADVLRLMAARRSVRRFADVPLPLQALSGLLAGLKVQAPLLSPAVRVDVVAQAVAGLAPGSYRFDPVRHDLLPRAVPAGGRARARAAALDQEVIGAAAAVLVLSADRAALAADALGAARGYRHAFLETGLVGERIYLEAAARGLGACAVGAFYDAEAEALVGVDPAREWVLHFAALGPRAG